MKRLFPHLTIILSLMTLTFFGIDRVNPIMAFMTSELSKWLFAALALSAVITSVQLIARQWKQDFRRARKRRCTEEMEATVPAEVCEAEPPAPEEPEHAQD